MRNFLGLFAVFLFAGSAHAEFTLDKRFVDRDGDLIADIPSAPSAFRDPAVLTLSYPPLDNQNLMASAWSDFVAYLEKLTGKTVEFIAYASNDEEVAAMRSGELHVAGFSTGTIPLAVSCAGARPFAVMASAAGTYGYQMEIIASSKSGIDAIEDIKGKTLAFTEKTSNSGYKAPTALLASRFGMKEGQDYSATYTGKHDNSVHGVVKGEFPAAAVASEVRVQMESRGEFDPDDIKVIYRSQTFPTTGYAVAHDLLPQLQDHIKQAFFSFNWEGSSLKAKFDKAGYEKFVSVNFKQDWSIVREIDSVSGVTYHCP